MGVVATGEAFVKEMQGLTIQASVKGEPTLQGVFHSGGRLPIRQTNGPILISQTPILLRLHAHFFNVVYTMLSGK